MIKTIIVEDEIAGQEVLKRNIHEYFPECKILSVVDHVDKAITQINSHEPDLVFLDIHIKGGTGFDILSYFKDRRFEVIFITAYNSYAIQAIKEEALDYILKPVNSTELRKGVSKAIDRIREKKDVFEANQLSVATYKGVEFINYRHIIFFEAKGSYTYIHLADSKIVSTKGMGEYEDVLKDLPFFRTHHSFIVNLNQIEKFNKGRNGILIMKTGHSIPVSQRKIKEFNEQLNEIKKSF